MGALASFAIPAAISAGSSIVSNLVTDAPEVPDFSARAQEEIDRARRRQRDQAEQQREDLEETLAARSASGLTSSAAREEMFDSQASASAELESRAADIISDAIRKEKMREFQRDQRVAQNRARAISDIGSGLATSFIASGLGEEIDFGFGGSDFSLDDAGAEEVGGDGPLDIVADTSGSGANTGGLTVDELIGN